MATSGVTVVDTPQGVRFFQLCAFIGAVSLEIKGMKHSSGLSMTARAKRAYGLKGNARKVLSGLEALREAMIAERQREASGS